MMELQDRLKLVNGLNKILNKILNEVFSEARRAASMFPPMNSPHEAEAVIREEFDEYWDEVKRHSMNKQRDTRPRQREELIQLAAMCVRAIYDTIDTPAKQASVPHSQAAGEWED
jgi:hypothetical protein